MSSPDQLQIVDAYWAQLRAVDARTLSRERARAHRRRLARTFAIAVLALLLGAAAALAARALLFGDDAPSSFPSQVESLGAIEPGSSRLLSVREPDVDGGPPWGVRIFRTSEGNRICVQAGRVESGRLVALGVAGAFGDDGRAHAVPVEATGCASQRPDGRLFYLAVVPIGARSGLMTTTAKGSAQQGCLVRSEASAQATARADAAEALDAARRSGDAAAVAVPQRRLEDALERLRRARPPCKRKDLRTVLVGLAGANAAAVTLSGHGSDRERDVRAEDEGAYVFVLADDETIGPDDLTVRYRDGTTCPLVGAAGPIPPSRPVTAECIRLRGG